MKSTTPYIQRQMQTSMYNNINQAFSVNTPLISAPDFENKRQTLHDNLGDKLFGERVVEYRALISSSDRDIKKYPSPFKMQVSFGNTNSTPNIDEYLTNVKYVTLNNVFVPRTVAIDTTQINLTAIPPVYTIYPTSSHLTGTPPTASDPSWLLDNLGFRPFLMLKIKELDDKHMMGTNPLFQRDSFMIVPDQKIGDMMIYKPKRSTIIYPNSLLKNLSMLTLNLLDENGSDINIVDQSGNKIIGKNISSSVTMDLNAYFDKYKDDRYVAYTNDVTRVIYDFTFGVIENELNTNTTYNKM